MFVDHKKISDVKKMAYLFRRYIRHG